MRPEKAYRLGWETAVRSVDERAARPLIVQAQRQGGEDHSAQHARTDAVATPAHSVDDVCAAAEMTQDGQAIVRAVDWPAPVVLDGHIGQHGVVVMEVGGHSCCP